MADHALSVWGVDISEESIACALENLELNQIGNAAFFAGERRPGPRGARRACRAAGRRRRRPAAGWAGGEGAQADGRARGARLVYVSCNPTTLASDVKVLREQFGYELVRTSRSTCSAHPARRDRVAADPNLTFGAGGPLPRERHVTGILQQLLASRAPVDLAPFALQALDLVLLAALLRLDDLQMRGRRPGASRAHVQEVVHERPAFVAAREREAAEDARPPRSGSTVNASFRSTGSTVAVTGGWSRVSRTTFVGVRSITSASRS